MRFAQLIDTRTKKLFWGVGIVLIFSIPFLIREPTIGPGDTVVLNYTISINGVISDTSLAEVAEKADIFDKDRTYEPLVIMIGGEPGENPVAPLAVERALLGMKVGEERTIRLYPLDAYGYWDPTRTARMSKEEFIQETGYEPVQGQTYQWGNVLFHISEMTEDTVVLDFNHRFAVRNFNRVEVSREEFEQSAEARIGNLITYGGQYAIVIDVTDTAVVLDVNPAIFEFKIEIIEIRKA